MKIQWHQTRNRIQYVKTGKNIYLRLDMLHPGDVILSKRVAKLSHWISALTDGPFSHATLVINETTRIEADTKGILFTPATIARYEDFNHDIRLLEKLPKFFKIAVFRHPQLIKRNGEKLSKEILDIVQPFLGLEYPQLKDLSKAINLSLLNEKSNLYAIKLAEVISQLIDSFGLESKKINPGPFCSALVVSIFKALGVPLFDSKKDPMVVSPNTLAKSKLTLVKEAICTSGPNSVNDKNMVKKFNEIIGKVPSRHKAENIVKLNAHCKYVKRLLKDFDQITDKVKLLLETMENQTSKISVKSKVTKRKK